jgi:hypothetical protein
MQELIAFGVGLDVPDPVSELRWRVVRHGRWVLEDVPVRVDVTEVGFSDGHQTPPVAVVSIGLVP